MEAVGRLAGGVAHDFNNLLTIIRGHGDLLLDRTDAVAAHRHSIEQIQNAAGRAVSMTRQLLAFSRMQVLQPRVLDLNAVVADMGKMLPRLIGEHIEYTFQPDQKLVARESRSGSNRAGHSKSCGQCARRDARWRRDHRPNARC